MSEFLSSEPMLDMFIFETIQNIEQLEKIIIYGEKTSRFSKAEIDEIFRIMHTIKGSSAMMSFSGISSLAHGIEDLFFYIRENRDADYDCSLVTDLILESIDFINAELENFKNGIVTQRDSVWLQEKLHDALFMVKTGAPASQSDGETMRTKAEHADEAAQTDAKTAREDRSASSGTAAGYEEVSVSVAANLFQAIMRFSEGCDMENIRAFNIVYILQKQAADISYFPQDLDSDESRVRIKNNGFTAFFRSDLSEEEVRGLFAQEVFLKDFSLVKFEYEADFEKEKAAFGRVSDDAAKEVDESAPAPPTVQQREQNTDVSQSMNISQSIISVNVAKLDTLMDMIGELVIAESMVLYNPDLNGLSLENFHKSAHQLHKITNELQDLAMSIRMVPLKNTFQKMNRIVRDLCRKLQKEVDLEITGEETEVDKNVIDHISDPLMHLVRNALDHGIESHKERLDKGKPQRGTVLLGARNEGGEIQIFVRDDGRGLNKEALLRRARDNDLLTKPESEMSEKEIYHLILHTGFSTNDTVTEYSGRGVGMDVVLKNIEALGGRITIESEEGKGTQITVHFPMTLAIIDGMNVRVGDCTYTLPITVIKETIKPAEKDIVKDPQGNEMILFRGECCPVVRLHRIFGLKADKETISDGTVVMVENSSRMVGIFVDELVGENQVVVKALPKYINAISGIAGCTILGDGSISLILDVAGLAA